MVLLECMFTILTDNWNLCFHWSILSLLSAHFHCISLTVPVRWNGQWAGRLLWLFSNFSLFKGGERKSWYRYTDGIGTRNPWVQKLFAHFREDAIRLRKACEFSSLPSSSSAPSLISGQQGLFRGGGGTGLKPGSSLSASTSPGKPYKRSTKMFCLQCHLKTWYKAWTW